MRFWVPAAIAFSVVGFASWLTFGVDWRNECEKVGLQRRCVATGEHDEVQLQLVSADPPIFMPVSETVTDYTCTCVGGAK